MPKYICLRDCFDGRMYLKGQKYDFLKGVEPNRHFARIKINEDGDVELVDKVKIRTGVRDKVSKVEKAEAKKVIAEATGVDLSNITDDIFKEYTGEELKKSSSKKG